MRFQIHTAGAALFVLTTACAAPFAEMQSARLAGPGRLEVTPNYSYMDIADEGESEKLQDTYGLHASTGLSDRVDLRLRLDHIRVEDSGGGSVSATVAGFGPKFGLIPNQLALYLPFGFAFGDDIEMSETWQFHPSMIWTIPVANTFEINTSLKALIPITTDDEDPNADRDVFTALNIGLGISPDLSKWVIRPEFGFLRDPDDGGGTIRHFSIGLTFFLGAGR